MDTISADELTKEYGENLAVNRLSLSVGSEIYGLLGPNGSGKTTTVNMLTTMLRPTSGNAHICGYDIETEQRRIRECISYVQQSIAADIKLTGRENVDLFAKLYGIRSKSERKRKTEEVLEIMGLSDRADDMTSSYSGGMHRRLEITQALIHDPQVLFLDEPTVGLDVSGRRTIWEHIVGLKNRGMAIFVTTHQMDEAERYCDRVGILRKGNLVREGTPVELTSSLDAIISIKADGPAPESVRGEYEVLREEKGEAIMVCHEAEDLNRIKTAYESSGMAVLSSTLRKPTLEDIYMLSIDEGTEDIGAFDRSRHNNMMRRRRCTGRSLTYSATS